MTPPSTFHLGQQPGFQGRGAIAYLWRWRLCRWGRGRSRSSQDSNPTCLPSVADHHRPDSLGAVAGRAARRPGPARLAASARGLRPARRGLPGSRRHYRPRPGHRVRTAPRQPRRRAARQGCVVAQPDRHAWPPGAGRRAPLTRSAPAFASGRGRASAQVVSRSGNDGLKNTRYLVRLSVPRAGGWRAWERLRRVRAPARRAGVL